MDHCLAPDCQMGGLGCDNMTVILVCLLNEQSYENLAEKCSTTPCSEALEKYEGTQNNDNERQNSIQEMSDPEEQNDGSGQEEGEGVAMDEEEMSLT